MRTRPELQGCGPDRKYASPSNPSGLMRRQRNRTAIILGCVCPELAAAHRLRKERGKAQGRPARGPGRRRHAAERAHLQRVGGATERPGECRDHAQGAGLPAQAGLPERLLRQEGPASVRARPAAVQAAVEQAKAQVAVAQANLAEGHGRRATRHSAGRAERNPAKAARYRPRQSGCHEGRSAGQHRPNWRMRN